MSLKNLVSLALPNIASKSAIYNLRLLAVLEVDSWDFEFEKNIPSLRSFIVRGTSSIRGMNHLIQLERLEYYVDLALRTELLDHIGALLWYSHFPPLISFLFLF